MNVHSERPPGWLVDRLAARVGGLGHYPSASDVARATAAVATRHGRADGEVALLAGGGEGFSLLPHLRAAVRPEWPRLVEAISEVLR